jgi:hypothetical protein
VGGDPGGEALSENRRRRLKWILKFLKDQLTASNMADLCAELV